MTPTQATQVWDDPSSTLEGLEEDEEITADTETNIIVTLCPSLYPMDTGWEKRNIASAFVIEYIDKMSLQ